MSIFLGRVTRSTSLLFVPLAVAAGAYIGTLALWEGVAVWDNAVSAIVAAALVAGPVHAFAATWDAGRDRRTGTDVYRQLSPQRRFSATMLDLAACWAATTLTFALLAGWFLLRTLAATWGTPNWLWVLCAGLGLLAQSSIGFLIGAFISARIAAPLAGIAVFFGNQALIQFLPAIGAANAGWLAFGREQQQNLFAVINFPLLSLQATWYLGVSLGVVAVLAIRNGGRLRGSIPVLVSALTALTVGLVGTQTSTTNFFLPQPRTFAYACDQSNTVCLHPAFATGLPDIVDAAAAMRERVNGTPFTFDSFEQRPRGYGGVPETGLAIHIDNLDTGWVSRDLGEAAQELTDPHLGPYGPCAGAEMTTGVGNLVGPGSIVVAWISGAEEYRIITNPDDASAAQTFDAWTEAQKKSWITAHTADICTGSLAPGDFHL